MSRQFRYIPILLSLLLLQLALAGCSNSSQESAPSIKTPVSHTYFIFDTVVTLRVFDERMTSAHFDSIDQLLKKIDSEMNRKHTGSEIDLVNRQAGMNAVNISEETFLVIETALKYAAQSGGRFDPTVGPIVDLWGIGSEDAAVPESGSLANALPLIGYQGVTLDRAALSVGLAKAGMSLDLGAIAKGYAADVIALYLKEQGFRSAIIDLGGNVIAMGGKPDGSDWTIGIQAPDEQRGRHLGIIKVNNKTIVTSGVYERFFKENGVVYHHILDPVTGYPVDNDLLSVTILTEESMVADAMSTSVFSLGLEDGLKFVEAHEGVEAVFITNERKIYVTPGLKGKLELTNKEYRFAE